MAYHVLHKGCPVGRTLIPKNDRLYKNNLLLPIWEYQAQKHVLLGIYTIDLFCTIVTR